MSAAVVCGGVVHTVPMDLRRVLVASPKAQAAWEDLTPLARNEWICWVLWPKKAETRSQHIQRVRSELLEGKRAVLLAWLHASTGQGTEPFGPLGAEPPRQSIGMNDASASQQIDAIVRKTAGWRGERLGQLRALIRGADPGVIEEGKRKKTDRPEGVPGWSTAST